MHLERGEFHLPRAVFFFQSLVFKGREQNAVIVAMALVRLMIIGSRMSVNLVAWQSSNMSAAVRFYYQVSF